MYIDKDSEDVNSPHMPQFIEWDADLYEEAR